MKARAMTPFYDFSGTKIPDLQALQHQGFTHFETVVKAHNCTLNHYYKDIKTLRKFLLQCQYLSDEKHFSLKDYWMQPSHFEFEQEGDCEDFALFTWKQLLHMGYDARFVLGRNSDNPATGHAWCTAIIKNKRYIIEPLSAKYPFLFSVYFYNYRPSISVSIQNGELSFYRHFS